MVCVGLSEKDLKNLGGTLGGQAEFWGGSCPLGTPLAPPLLSRSPRATVMYKWATLLSKGPLRTVVMCKYLALQGAQSNYNA